MTQKDKKQTEEELQEDELSVSEKKEKVVDKAGDETKAVEKGSVENLIATPASEKKEVQDSVAEDVENEDLAEEMYKHFALEEYTESIDSLKKGYEKMEKMDSVSRDFVLDLRRDLMVFKELTTYLLHQGLIEVKGESDLIFSVNEEYQINISEKLLFVDDLENKLKSYKQGEKKEAPSIYEDLEKKLSTIKVKDFLKLPLGKRLELISNVEDWDKIKENQLVVFDFGGNRKLERQIGLGDIMPSNVRKISLGGAVYERRGNQGFYRNGKYLAIWTGSRVSISEREKDYSSEKEYTSTFGTYKPAEKDEQIAESNEITTEEIIAIAHDFLVDAHLLISLVDVLKADLENNVSQGYEFLHMAARYIQNAQAKYESKGHKAFDANHYTANFIAFALDRFNLMSNYTSISDQKIKDVVAKYADLKGITLEFNDKVQAHRNENKPLTYTAYNKLSNKDRKRYAERGGEVVYENPVGGKGVDMIGTDEALKQWRATYYKSLIDSGVPAKQAKINVFYAEKIYKKFQQRMGSMYNSKVKIRSYNGHTWTIKNSCVGAGMKPLENLPIHCVRGKQTRKYASQYVWCKLRGGKRDIGWIDSMVEDKNDIVKMRITPSNCDELIGAHLLPGECAPAGLWNHCLWLYKRFDGTIVIAHSGADVRPKRIPVNDIAEAPAGYVQRGNYYVRQRGSKFNELPLRDFLAKRQGAKGYTAGTWRSAIKFLPLRNIVKNNIQQTDFLAYYDGASDQDKVLV